MGQLVSCCIPGKDKQFEMDSCVQAVLNSQTTLDGIDRKIVDHQKHMNTITAQYGRGLITKETAASQLRARKILGAMLQKQKDQAIGSHQLLLQAQAAVTSMHGAVAQAGIDKKVVVSLRKANSAFKSTKSARESATSEIHATLINYNEAASEEADTFKADHDELEDSHGQQQREDGGVEEDDISMMLDKIDTMRDMSEAHTISSMPVAASRNGSGGAGGRIHSQSRSSYNDIEEERKENAAVDSEVVATPPQKAVILVTNPVRRPMAAEDEFR
jgi:hypothetical protein